MKKKICFVLTIVLLVSAMVFSLVGCNNVKPYKVENKEDTLFEIWNTWANGNFSTDDKTLGVDAKISATLTDKDGKKTETNISILGGISTVKGSKSAFKLTNEIKNDGQISKSSTIINQDALYIVDGDEAWKDSSQKLPDISAIQIPEELKEMLKIESIQDIDIAENISSIKSILLPILSDAVDAETFIITPVKNGKTYDVTYTFSLSIEKLITKVVKELDTLTSVLGEDFKGIVEGLKAQLNQIKEKVEGINIDFTIKTTGNTMEKDKKTKAISYTGGTMTDFEAKTKTKEAETVIKVDIKLTNTIPQITPPANAQEIPQYPIEPNPDPDTENPEIPDTEFPEIDE